MNAPPAFLNKTLACMYMPVCLCDYVQLYIYMYVFMYTCTVVHVCSVLPRTARQALLIHQNNTFLIIKVVLVINTHKLIVGVVNIYT